MASRFAADLMKKLRLSGREKEENFKVTKKKREIILHKLKKCEDKINLKFPKLPQSFSVFRLVFFLYKQISSDEK
jgi:hypothetical protein